MKCEIIFYLAKKTSLCEKALRQSVERMNLHVDSCCMATSPRQLGQKLIDALESSNLVFIVGGLGIDGKSGIENILSKALANKQPDELKKARNPLSSCDGYIIRQGGQLIVLLTDEPNEISALLSGELREYLEAFTWE